MIKILEHPATVHVAVAVLCIPFILIIQALSDFPFDWIYWALPILALVEALLDLIDPENHKEHNESSN